MGKASPRLGPMMAVDGRGEQWKPKMKEIAAKGSDTCEYGVHENNSEYSNCRVSTKSEFLGVVGIL